MAVEGLVATGPPALPKWLLFLRIGIIVVSLAVLIAAAINIAAFDDWWFYSSSSGPAGFLIFDVIFTWIVIGSMLIFEWRFHQFFLRLAYVVLLPLGAIFWLSAWAWSADVASAFDGDWSGLNDDLDRFHGSIAACAALGAFTWVAIIVLTIFYILACIRDDSNHVAAHQTEMGGVPKQEHTSADQTFGGATAVAQPTEQFNQQQQQQQYYPPQQQQQQQTPYPQQEIPQYPPQNGAQYPPQQTQSHP